MKRLICFLILIINILTSCGTASLTNPDNESKMESSYGNSQQEVYSSKQDISSSESVVLEQPYYKQFSKNSDEWYIAKYIESLDIALGMDNNLLFDDAKKISQETLFRFFIYIVAHEKNYDYNSCYDEKAGQFVFPSKDVDQIVSRYFDITGIEKQKVSEYSADKDAYIVAGDPFGFGGARYIKILSKEYPSGNILKLVAGFYDENYATCQYTKTYLIEEKSETYKYLSISEQKN